MFYWEDFEIGFHFPNFSAMKIASLVLYPIKGMSGISVSSAIAAPEGFVHDRRWMLVDHNGTFISQRSHPQLALFKTNVEKDSLVVGYNGAEIAIPFSMQTEKAKQVSVFDASMHASLVDVQFDQWFSEQLQSDVHLVKHSSITKRKKKLIKAPDITPVSFADGYPYLILGTASLAELNSKLATAIPMNRFRPNIIVETTDPHEEDDWNDLKIGAIDFRVIKPCARCQVITIDQASAERGKEPLKTLASYRKWDNNIWFGANAVSLSAGEINIDDKILIL